MRRVCERLEAEYGQPRLGNPRSPIDDMVYIILSNKTSPPVAVQTYRRLKKRFRTWNELLRTRKSVARAILEPAGLSTVKSEQLRSALQTIRKDFGRCTLSPLKNRSTVDVEAYLVSLPGVSEKVAKCVIIYTMGRDVLPVDGHVHRVATRLGWTARKRADQCHRELEALVPPHRRYAFHVDCVVHSRKRCRPKDPMCENCCVRRYCRYIN